MRAPKSPDDWSMAITPENIVTIPASYGVPDHQGQLWRPVCFGPPDYHLDPRIYAINSDNEVASLHPTDLPHMGTFWDREIGNDPPQFFTLLQHRKGDTSTREPYWRILSILSLIEGQAAEVRFGEHPDHPGEEGFYLGAAHLGSVTLDFSEVRYLPPEDVVTKYFPFPGQQPVC